MGVNFVIRIIGAALLFGIGLVGLIMPLLPGWIFLPFAVLLLFPHHRWTKRSAEAVERRFPSSKRFLEWLLR